MGGRGESRLCLFIDGGGGGDLEGGSDGVRES